MWGLAFATTGISAAMLPSEMRPMRASEALSRLSKATDSHAAARMWAAFGMLNCATGALQRLRAHELDAFSADNAFIPDVEIPILAVEFAALLQASVSLMIEFLVRLLKYEHTPCFDPSSCGTIAGKTLKTSLHSSVTVKKPLSQVAPLLDPRAWAKCSKLFERTCKVAEPKACVPCCVIPAPNELGKNWNGVLYERAVVGYQKVENLLSIDFSVCDVGTAQGRLSIDYSLYRSISHRFGVWELPGLMRNNSGTVAAEPTGPHKEGEEPPYTAMTVTKLISYGRSDCWSGSSTMDFGELCNYLAPAFLTLWVTDVQFIVPCCPE
jgi:hypothetical protein